MARTISVFEHDTLRVLGPGRSENVLSEAEFDALVRFNDRNERRYFEVGHRRITFGSHVGFLQVGELGIEILPKVDRASREKGEGLRWRRALLEMIAIATGLRLESPTSATQSTRRASLLELVAAKYVEELERQLHGGLLRGYRFEESNGPTFRGRLLVAENLRANAARADRFYVRHSVYDHDTPLNRVLCAALEQVHIWPVSAGVASRAKFAAEHFSTVARLRPSRARPGALVLTRATLRFQAALTLAGLILERSAPDLSSGRSEVFAILFDMALLWERFVASVLRREAGPDLLVSAQESKPFWAPERSATRTVRPDIVVRSAATRDPVMVIDTKWKQPKNGAPADHDLQQMFAYNERWRAPLAVLVYPALSDSRLDRIGPFIDKEHRLATYYLGLRAARGQADGLAALPSGDILRPRRS